MGKTIKYTKESFNKKLKEIGREDVSLKGEYINSRTSTEFHCNICGNDWFTAPINFTNKNKNGKCPVCHKREIKEKYKLSQEEVERRVKEANKDIEVISRYKNYYVPIKFKCKIDGYEWEQTLSNFLNNPICPLCNSDKTYRLIVGVNDLATLRPDLIKYFKNPEDAKTLKLGSNKKMTFKCPDCGREKEMCVCTLVGCGFSCPYCSDKISYPNKFLRAFLNQLNIEYKLEWQDEWCKPYKYDAFFKLNGKKYLIEMDGNYHTEENCLYFKTQHTNVKIRDATKTKLAKENNHILIRIDCYKSDGDYIINNIINSDLANLFDLEKINWFKCKEDAEKSLVKEVCDYYNNNINSYIKDIAQFFNLYIGTVTNYIKRGAELGFTRNLLTSYNGVKITLFKNNKRIASYGSYCVLERRSEDDIGEYISRDKIKKIVKKNGGEIGNFRIVIANTIEDISDIYYK